MNIDRQIGSGDGFQFVGSRFDTFFGEVEPKVRPFLASEVALLQVHFESMDREIGEDGIEHKQVFLICACMSQ